MPPDSSAHVDEEYWVFAYGSLMWRPGFAFAERAAGPWPFRGKPGLRTGDRRRDRSSGFSRRPIASPGAKAQRVPRSASGARPRKADRLFGQSRAQARIAATQPPNWGAPAAGAPD